MLMQTLLLTPYLAVAASIAPYRYRHYHLRPGADA